MIIVSPQYGSITLNKINSETLPRPYLNDSNTFFCEHDFGTITIQQYESENYFLRFAVLNLVKKISFFIHDEISALKSTFSLNNTVNLKTKWTKLKLKKGQYLIYGIHNDPLSFYFENKGQYQILEGNFSRHLLEDLFAAFPSLKAYLDRTLARKAVLRIEHAHPASPEMKKIVTELLQCPYDQQLQKIYFENRVNDLLFEMLVQGFKNEAPAKSPLSAHEYTAVIEAKELILKDITQHYSISALSKMVNLNTLKLKTGFKQTFGAGLFEYLLQARMKKAYELITETDRPIKEIASITGFEYVQNFINSFRRYYGKTPGELRKT